MKQKRIVSLTIVLLVFVLAMLCITKSINIGRKLSELKIERQYSRDVSVSVTGAPTLPLKGNEINLTNTDIRQNHLQVNNLPELSTGSENIAYPQVCASQWLDDGITVQEMLRCVEGNASKTNGAQGD